MKCLGVFLAICLLLGMALPATANGGSRTIVLADGTVLHERGFNSFNGAGVVDGTGGCNGSFPLGLGSYEGVGLQVHSGFPLGFSPSVEVHHGFHGGRVLIRHNGVAVKIHR